jgi:hypothetical protein
MINFLSRYYHRLHMKKALFIFILFFVPAQVFCAGADINSIYQYDYYQAPEFQPSLNSQFTSLARGVTDVLANPAGITKVNTFEVAIGFTSFVQNPIKSDSNVINVDDVGMKGVQGSPNSRAYARLTEDRTAVSAESRPLTIDEDYSKGGGITYMGATYKVADWLSVAITRKRPTSIAFNYNVVAPLMTDIKANFRDTTVESGGPGNMFWIRPDGTIEVIVGGVAAATSEAPLWSGFLEQGTSEVNTVNATFDNSITNDNSIVLTAAAKTGNFSWGLNIMPESIQLNLDNDVNVTSNSDNGRLTYYIPDIDFNSTTEALNWAASLCTLESGYRSVEVETLPGQQIGSAKVAGNYSASFVKMDFGMQWDPTDYLSVGGVYENFNGAKYKLEGVNVIQYVQHRVDTTSKAPTLEGDIYWDPFLATATHETEVEETIRNVLDMKAIELPKKLKFGMSLKKPFILAVDWEQWQNEYAFSSDPGHPVTAKTITIKDISFIKFGMESQLGYLPLIMRGSITGLLRPATNDPDTEKNLDDLYATIPVVPVDGNIYLGMGAWDGEVGLGVGGGGLPLLKAVMFDMSSFAKVFYYNVYYKKGDWQLSYLATLDPVLTGFSSDISTTQGEDSKIRLMQTSTVSMGYKF